MQLILLAEIVLGAIYALALMIGVKLLRIPNISFGQVAKVTYSYSAITYVGSVLAYSLNSPGVAQIGRVLTSVFATILIKHTLNVSWIKAIALCLITLAITLAIILVGMYVYSFR